jgi:hypothetical protein
MRATACSGVTFSVDDAVDRLRPDCLVVEELCRHELTWGKGAAEEDLACLPRCKPSRKG